MPKIIELTVEIDIQKVSCPGVWLCQGGRVCLTVFALGTSYQTCLLPPIFPLMFKDVFYFKKRFQEACALNNICCLLKDETIYCELVQFGANCVSDECVILAQYLGAMNDVLFPPNMCSNDGVDLLMRRSKVFPGILSPKIEIATKVRIDEIWNQPSCRDSCVKVNECECRKEEAIRQKQVCHSARYHRVKCDTRKAPGSRSSSRSRSRSGGSSSWGSVSQKPATLCRGPNPTPCSRRRSGSSRSCRNYCGYSVQHPIKSQRETTRNGKSDDRDDLISSEPLLEARRRSDSPPSRDYYVYNVQTPSPLRRETFANDFDDSDYTLRSPGYVLDATEQTDPSLDDNKSNKITLESRYIDHDKPHKTHHKERSRKCYRPKTSPCVCEICKRYHELFHSK